MFLVDRQSVPAALRDEPCTRLKLRVRADGQVIELAEGKTTIGSSPRCNLRLDRPGVEPLHCLVMDGPDGLRVRRWAADTRLNGEQVEDAPLEAGDCLSLGGVELELVGPVRVPELPSAELVAELAEEQLSSEPPSEASEFDCELACEEKVAVDEPLEMISRLVDAEVETEDFTAGLSDSDSAIATTQIEQVPSEVLLLEWHKELMPLAESCDEPEANAKLAETIDFIDLQLPFVIAASESIACEEKVCECEGLEEGANNELLEEAAAEPVSCEDNFLAESDAAEFVFRQLQDACSVARGRNRKMLAAMRNLRAEKNSLVLALENSDHSEGFARERADWEADRQRADQEQRELHLELKELRRQLGEWETRLVDHTQQMANLQSELVAARANGNRVGENHPLVSERELVEPAAFVLEPFETLPTAYESTSRSEAWEPMHDEVTSQVVAEEVVPAPVDEVRADGEYLGELSKATLREELPPTDVNHRDSDPWEMPSEQASASPAEQFLADEVEVAAEAWSEPATSKDSQNLDVFYASERTELEPVERAAWESNEVVGEAAADEDLSPFAEFSIWKQGATAEEAFPESQVSPLEEEAGETPAREAASSWGSRSFEETPSGSDAADQPSAESVVADDSVNPWAAAIEKAAAESKLAVAESESPAAPVESSSFIDRYSHLFAEENDSVGEKSEAPVAQPTMPAPLNSPMMKPATSSMAGSEDEESIEQYMANLMRRVRGESPAVATSIAAPAAGTGKLRTPSSVEPTAELESAEPKDEGNATADESKAEEENAEVAVNWDNFARRATSAPATNLGALRAIANETARRDIGIHRLKTHRRDAKTKVIVSTLAGMTSLWLMLDSPDWRNSQFITACISLLVAAYWAGEAFREMIRSMRVKNVGPGMVGNEDPALPIDVEG